MYILPYLIFYMVGYAPLSMMQMKLYELWRTNLVETTTPYRIFSGHLSFTKTLNKKINK